MIAPDRTGIGLSDHSPDRSLLNWADDASDLADALHTQRFAVCGFSFGGPYARACAYKMPDRIMCAGLISCLGAVESGGSTGGMPMATKLMLAASRRAPGSPVRWSH